MAIIGVQVDVNCHGWNCSQKKLKCFFRDDNFDGGSFDMVVIQLVSEVEAISKENLRKQKENILSYFALTYEKIKFIKANTLKTLEIKRKKIKKIKKLRGKIFLKKLGRRLEKEI